MQLTPGQLKQILEISEETLRYWRKRLPGSAKKGYSPCFTFGEVLCFRIIKELCIGFGMKISAVEPALPSLLGICGPHAWIGDSDWYVVYEPAGNTIRRMAASSVVSLKSAAIVIPVTPLVAELRKRLLNDGREEQFPLPLPPVGLQRGRSDS
jgi:hypothetical protein